MCEAYYRVGKREQERKEIIIERWRTRAGFEDKPSLTEVLCLLIPVGFILFCMILGMIG